MAIIGIDLGTTNSLVSVYRNGRAELLPNEWGQLLTPSCVGVLEDGAVTVGAVAKERLITHPGETAASFKTWMGTQKEFLLGGKFFPTSCPLWFFGSWPGPPGKRWGRRSRRLSSASQPTSMITSAVPPGWPPSWRGFR